MVSLSRAVAASLLLLLPAGAAEAALQPHLAAYRLSLAERHQGSPLSDVRGGLVIEWRLGCDGWLSRQRLGFVAATEEGEAFSHDVRFSSWENTDGSRLRYSVRSFEGEHMQEEYRGEAWMKGAGGRARFSVPEAKEVALPAGTVFPTDHLQRIIADARARHQLVSHKVFDGWGFDALTQITTVIGRSEEIKVWSEDAGEDGTERAWPVTMAYYDLTLEDSPPEFEAIFMLTERGVLQDLKLDYGDFRLDAKLERLEFLQRPECG